MMDGRGVDPVALRGRVSSLFGQILVSPPVSVPEATLPVRVVASCVSVGDLDMPASKPRIVAVVPIKVESVRLPGKNFRPLGGRPLYRHVIDTLSHVRLLDNVYLYSAAESDRFDLPVGVDYVCERPVPPCEGKSALLLAQEFCSQVESAYYFWAHATSPFLAVRTVERAIETVLDGVYDSAFAVQRIETFAWYDGRPINYCLSEPPRTQDLAPLFLETSAFYLFHRDLILGCRRRIGSRPYFCELSFPENVDIDHEWQFRVAEIVHDVESRNASALPAWTR